MKSNRTRGAVVAALCATALVVGGAAAVLPAASAKAGINWGQIWKTQLQPRADKRYYKKKQVYTKAQATARFAPFPKVIRGTFDVSGAATGSSQYLASSISFGVTLAAPPTIHYINAGDPVPTGCSGTPQAPNAAPGNLCVFEVNSVNTNARGTYDPTTHDALFASSNTMGITVYGNSAAAGQVFSFGTWALHPAALASGRTGSPAPRATGPGAVR